MADYYQKSMNALQLAGKSERIQECYTRSVCQLVAHYETELDSITEKDLEEYFLYRANVDEWKPATLKIAYAGIKFYFVNVLKREWHIFKYLHARHEQKLPCILSTDEVFCVLDHIKTFHNFCFASMVYATGLRLSEALALQVTDIDGSRMMIHVHRGKGAKDRYVELPKNIYLLLREYWATHRNKVLIFPALGRSGKNAPYANKSMARASVQGAFRKAVVASGIKKRRVTIHTLRHCYATHLLEAGVNVRLIQQYMGHSQLETTMKYFHLTQKGTEDASKIINSVMQGFKYDGEY